MSSNINDSFASQDGCGCGATPKENKINNMGSVVEDGYACKPVVRERDKPIMFYKSHILICHGERCASTHKEEGFIDNLREIIKSMELHRGKNRIKLTKADCFGACRFRGVFVLYQNISKLVNNDNIIVNSALWVQRIQKLSKAEWRSIFDALARDIPLGTILKANSLIPMKVY